jgi:hypothetical protein
MCQTLLGGRDAEKTGEKKRQHVTQEQVYQFAWGCIELGTDDAKAAATVICFEWLQRSENVIAGYIRWIDYRAWPACLHDPHRSPQNGEIDTSSVDEITETRKFSNSIAPD